MEYSMATGLKFIALIDNHTQQCSSAFWTLGMGMTALLRATLFPILDRVVGLGQCILYYRPGSTSDNSKFNRRFMTQDGR